MAFLDKNHVLDSIYDRPRVEIELGCGPRKRSGSSVGVDIADYPGVDVVGDAADFLKALKDNSVDSISSFHFMEHVCDVSALMRESARVLKPGGAIHCVVPHFSNPYYYSDPTHKTHFGLYSMCYFSTNTLFRRKVPCYTALPLRLLSVRLGFKSTPPFYGRHALKRVVGLIVNLTRYGLEYYEENLCWLVPCYEIEYLLQKH
jgi:SAM-dependent methyltransferase